MKISIPSQNQLKHPCNLFLSVLKSNWNRYTLLIFVAHTSYFTNTVHELFPLIICRYISQAQSVVFSVPSNDILSHLYVMRPIIRKVLKIGRPALYRASSFSGCMTNQYFMFVYCMSPSQAAMVPKDDMAMGSRMHSQVRTNMSSTIKFG